MCQSARIVPEGVYHSFAPSLLELDASGLSVGLTGVDLLSGLLDGSQNGLVGEGGFGDDGCELGVKGDVV